jgi:maltose alpha-D-glucosyltransferase/alpha-amylase
MVTEEERQFMWDYYAPQPRMRLNLGIRRRLAPLLDNNRARLELANALLFSLPGAPVIYYGDEIGMGDDIWLPDRDGVRTPMQWTSGAANAGFSTAAPSDLYAPVIEDEVYGYRQVNVADQRSDPGSLLNWTRKAIRIRKAHPALGRGDVRFLQPDNQALLALLRTHGDETILALSNLSGEPLSVDLDLAPWARSRPTDLFSGATLPPVGSEPYHLEIEGYGYLWLRLSA